MTPTLVTKCYSSSRVGTCCPFCRIVLDHKPGWVEWSYTCSMSNTKPARDNVPQKCPLRDGDLVVTLTAPEAP